MHPAVSSAVLAALLAGGAAGASDVEVSFGHGGGGLGGLDRGSLPDAGDLRDLDPKSIGQALRAAAPRIRSAITRHIRDRLGDDTRLCGRLPERVRLSCLAVRYGALAATLPADGDYAPVSQGLAETAQDLRRLAGDAADRTVPRQAYATRTVRTGALTALRPDALPGAHARAVARIEALQWVLLRSTEASRKRRLHYQRIAAALDGGKVLLRSS